MADEQTTIQHLTQQLEAARKQAQLEHDRLVQVCKILSQNQLKGKEPGIEDILGMIDRNSQIIRLFAEWGGTYLAEANPDDFLAYAKEQKPEWFK